MLPRFLQPEVVPFTSIEVVPAAPADCPHCDGYAFVGHVCPAEFDADQDPHPHDEDDGAECSAACGYCGRCS